MIEHSIHVYNVGQGLCTMLRGRLEGDETYLGIFDCGTLKEGKVKKKNVVDKIVEYANECGHIDSIVVSHQDSDHWSMLLDIIQAFYGIQSNTIISKNSFYIERKNGETDILEMNEDTTIEYFKNILCKETELDFEVKVDKNNVIYEFKVSAQYEESEGLGTCEFTLTRNKDSHVLMFSVWIDNMKYEDEKGNHDHYDKTFESEFKKDLHSENWKNITDIINYGELYKEIENDIGYHALFHAHLNHFGQKISAFCFEYGKMKKLISSETNFIKGDKYIKQICLGGDYWGIGYQRLHMILQILTSYGLINEVNEEKKCGLIRADEKTVYSGEESTEFEIDTDLMDCKTHRKTDMTSAIKHNATSLIVDFDASDEIRRRILFPGDATVHVFSQLTEQLKGSGMYDSTFMLAPHHGSLHTNYCDEASEDEQPFIQLLRQLSTKREGEIEKNGKIDGCVISALTSVFSHPDKRFIDDILKYVKEIPSELMHDICYGEDKKEKKIPNVEQNVYCTQMFQSIGRRWWSKKPDNQKAENKVLEKKLPPKNVFI